MRLIFSLIFIFLCFNAVAQSDTAWVHQKAKAIKLLNQGYFAISFSANSLEINHRVVAPILAAGITMSTSRLTFDALLTTFNNRNNLYYTFDDSPGIKTTDYNYSLYYAYINLAYLVKTVTIGTSIVSLNAGVRLEIFQVGDPNPLEISKLALNGNSHISISQMGNNLNYSGYLELVHPFWIANQSFSINLSGGAPFYIGYSKAATFSENTYNPKSRTLLSLGLKYNIATTLTSNPLKSKTL
ncbi:MAG: hypothetical protein ABI203_05765 [Mucilaginibacter sp.]